MCEILKINRAAYYKWKNHRNSENDELNEQIVNTALKIHGEYPDMGYRRIRDTLEHDYNITINDKRVLRICCKRKVPEFLSAPQVVTLETMRLAVDGHFGTWYSIDSQHICNGDYFLMKHNEFGDDTVNIIVNSKGKLATEEIANGFSPEIVELITCEALYTKISME